MTPDFVMAERRSDAQRVSDQLTYQQQAAADAETLAEQFKQAVKAGDIDSVALGQICVRCDFLNREAPGTIIHRPEKLAETMAGLIEGDPIMTRVAMRALMICSNTGNVVAQEAIAKMALAYGVNNV